MTCNLSNLNVSEPLELNRHRWLHQEGNRLITNWFEKAWAHRDDEDAVFESFIFAWFSVNAWAACVTDIDRDIEYIKRLQGDSGLNQRFDDLLEFNSEFANAAREFHGMWPIFKAQNIRRAQLQAGQGLSRHQVIKHYLDAGLTSFEPDCWTAHRDAGEPVPLDWTHTLAAIYRVRNNLFHGEKSAHSEMDRTIVRAAFATLILFFRRAEIL